MITHFNSLPNESGNSRFFYIADLLEKKGIVPEILTTSFSHIEKSQRNLKTKLNYNINYCYEPNYQKNISFKRFHSHFIFAKNVKKYLKNRKKPDVVYCSIPSLDIGGVVAKYCKKNNVKFIIDIQDLWPEAFQMVFNVPLINNIIFYPFVKKADYIYSSADEIIAVSETYAKRALRVNKNCKEINSIFLGTELKTFDKLRESNKIIRKDNEIWIGYIGTLGHSYDITCVIDAIENLKEKGYENLKFIIMGDGPLKTKFENYAESKDINYNFTGRLKYAEMVGLLCSCDIAVNPISKGAAQSIINKVGDYAAAGLSVINSQECEEYRYLIEKYNCGINCKNNDFVDISEKLELLIKNKNLRKKTGENSRKLAEEKFDREETYNKILKILLKD